MNKIGLLTYHYSNNYGGVLQCYSLYKYLESKGLDVEIINYIPSYVNLESIFYETGLRKNIFKIKKDDIIPISNLINRVSIKRKYNKSIVGKFDSFRNKNMRISNRVDENDLHTILNDYKTVVVGSDQVWSPGERSKKIYFLDYENFQGQRISYAADSTIEHIDSNHYDNLKRSLNNFDVISVRNEHSFQFVKKLTNIDPEIVVDPTLLWDFRDVDDHINNKRSSEEYILVYVLGKEIDGANSQLIEKIREKYGNIKVIAVTIPTRKFNECNYADEILYDIGPDEWLSLFRNATFVLTDSFHGTLFSLKFKRPFLAYYAEKLRATRFLDLGKRYGISDFIINDFNEIEIKNSLSKLPNYDDVEKLISQHVKSSEVFLKKALALNNIKG